MNWRQRLGERFPNVTRHLSILGESWRRQNDADKKIKPRSDHEFLPAALEIMEKPPSPGLRWLMLSICGLLVVTLLWSIFGRVDVVATASGKVVPAGNVKLIQPIEIGYVRAIHVKNGQHVKAGQLLVELDPTLVGAEAEQAAKGLLTAQVAAARNAALLGRLNGTKSHFVAPLGTPPEIAATQTRLVHATIAEYEAQRAGLLERRAENVAQLASVDAEIAKLKETLPIVEKQLAARRELSEKGYFSKIRLLEYEQLKIEHVQDIVVQEANAARARATIETIDAQLAELRSSFGKDAVTELAASQEKSGIARGEVTKSQRRQAYLRLHAPVSGTVQQLAIATVGGVVQPAQTLMIIVPDNAAPVVEARILNKDIGFVHEGQRVRVKLEAYPFTDYGIVPGVVESISRDAVDTSQPGTAEQLDRNGRVVQPGLVYTSRIRLLQRSIRVRGRDQPIGPGLAVQAEIKTGDRRIIQYLLSPISQALDEAGRER